MLPLLQDVFGTSSADSASQAANGGMRCAADGSPDFGVRAELHHVITAEAVLSSLLAVVGADGFAIQECAVQAAGVSDLPAALIGVPPDDDMVARHLSVRHRQGIILQPPNSDLLSRVHHVSHAVQCSTAVMQCNQVASCLEAADAGKQHWV